MKKYQIWVLGIGPVDLPQRCELLILGKRYSIIEGGEIGAAGVKWGALASKSRRELAKDFAIAAKQDRGYQCAYEIQSDKLHL